MTFSRIKDSVLSTFSCRVQAQWDSPSRWTNESISDENVSRMNEHSFFITIKNESEYFIEQTYLELIKFLQWKCRESQEVYLTFQVVTVEEFGDRGDGVNDARVLKVTVP